MESIAIENQLIHKKSLMDWLTYHCQLICHSIQPMQGDASFRRYHRVYTSTGTFVLMEAPSDAKCDAYIAIANALRKMGIITPEILAADLSLGLLLITDFGHTTYLQALNLNNADQHYGVALDALALLQSCQQVEQYAIPSFSAEWMLNEWAWHKEWFASKLLGIDLQESERTLDECMQRIVHSACSQPQVFMHRDFHSGNLMVLNENRVGVLDFQDAFFGPITYDLVSLLRDCYISWPKEKVREWVQQYLQLVHHSIAARYQFNEATFLQWFDWMGIQRHLKALMTFARKTVRDEQSAYLQFVPRTLHYIHEVSQQYSALEPIVYYLERQVLPACAKRF